MNEIERTGTHFGTALIAPAGDDPASTAIAGSSANCELTLSGVDSLLKIGEPVP